MVRLLSDENINGDLIRTLLQLRPTIDLIRVQDVGLRGATDPTILAWAAEDDRILLTHDRATVPDFAFARCAAGQSMTGVFVLAQRRPIRQIIDELLMIDACSDHAEWAGRVVHLPL